MNIFKSNFIQLECESLVTNYFFPLHLWVLSTKILFIYFKGMLDRNVYLDKCSLPQNAEEKNIGQFIF